VKATIEIPDDVFQSAKAIAAIRGETITDVVIRALEAHLRSATASSGQQGWRRVFGRATREDMDAIDRLIATEFERIDAAEWR
jgi:hypothetical protein